MRSDVKYNLERLIINVTSELSVDLIEWDAKKRNGTLIINVIADRPQGGITIDECTLVNKRIVAEIDQECLLGDDYAVEVSSPGLDRRLKQLSDFNRAVGRKVRFHLKEPIAGKVEHHGAIVEVKNNQIKINAKDGYLDIPLESISKAVQVVDYE